MRAKIGNADGVFKQRNSRGIKLFTEPDLNTVVLPFLGILPPPHPRFINNKKKHRFIKLWWHR
jgi:hypothetical protein